MSDDARSPTDPSAADDPAVKPDAARAGNTGHTRNTDSTAADAEPSRRGPLAWFAGNIVASNLIMLFLLGAGIITLLGIKVEIFPTIETDMVRINIPYRGAAPAEVETGVILRVEEAIDGIENIKRIQSFADEGLATVVVEIDEYADSDAVLEDIQNEVDRIDTLPEETEQPVVALVDNRTQVITIAIHGDASERTLKELAERIRDDLTTRPTISQVDLTGTRDYEISIEVRERDLRKYGLTFDDVAQAVGGFSVDLPGGSIRTEGGEILLRTPGQKYTGDEFATIPLITTPEGAHIRLDQIADVRDTFEASDMATFFDGERAALLNVFRVGEQGALEVAGEVKQYVQAQRAQLPAGIDIDTWFDRSAFLKDRIELLLRNASIGLVLVFLCLTLFLDLRLAFWTTMGIPISFLGALWLLPIMGVSINMISLFAFIVVLGIVVDDAIVVGENIFEYRQRGMNALSASIAGVREMASPVTFAILTSVAAFAPLLFTAGEMGKILRVIPVVVISVLLISLVEALVILPAHLAQARVDPNRRRGPIARAQNRVRAALRFVIDRLYTPTLRLAVRFRYATLALAFAVLGVTVGAWYGGIVQFKFFPPLDADNVWVSLTLPPGTPIERTEQVVERIETAARELGRELEAERGEYGIAPDAGLIFPHMSSTIGSKPFSEETSGSNFDFGGISRANIAEINLEMMPGEQRANLSATEVANRWRAKIGEMPGVESLTINSSLFSAGEPINVELSHRDFDTLLRAADELQAILAEFPGVWDIADSFEPGKRELELALTPEGEMAGLTLEHLARQIRQGFFGDEVQRVQRGREDVRIMVRYTEDARETRDTLETMRIRLPDGTEMPFHRVAEFTEGRGYARIERADRRRIVSVTAEVDEQVANANELNRRLSNEILPDLKNEYTGLAFGFEGEQREQSESLDSLMSNTVIAMLVIFALLGIQFRSYVQPLIVMSAIPFGIVGAIAGHLIMGYNLSLLSMFGIVALAGVVVNDSLIMIDLINRERSEGIALHRVLIDAGTRRFRPIMLTTATTFFGLSPMIFETSLQAKFLIPMALSLGFGVVFATVITLILVPVGYMVIEDLKLLLGVGAPDHPDLDPTDLPHARMPPAVTR